MKNIKKLIFSVSFAIIILFAVSGKVQAANTINKIDMDVYINPNGTAEITEIWQANLTQGTEGYKPYSNLGKCKITDFSVSDDLGNTYTTRSIWNTSESFENKSNKCGIVNKSNGVELCWGISKYGNRTYTLKYNITNFVNQYNDSQGIYFSLMPKEMKQSPKHVLITIRSNENFTKDNSKIWAFGYANGTINFENGKIVMNSNGVLASSSYMTALIKFENNIFSTNNKINSNFNDIYEDAMSSVSKNEKSETQGNIGFLGIISTLLLLPIYLIFNPITWIVLILIFLRKKNINRRIQNSLNFGSAGKDLPDLKNVDYYRDIPCNKDIYRAYWVISQYEIKDKNNVLLGAVLLNWIKDGKATISKTRKGLFNFKDNNYAIDLNGVVYGTNEVENELIKALKEASGDNEILESKEFEKWCKKNYTFFDNWTDKVINYVTNQLEKEGLIKTTETTEQNKGFIKGTRTIINRYVDASMKEEAIRILGLKRFLLEYSMIDQRQAIEVHLWEEYLIFAQLLGIAEKVEEQFSKLYPEFKEQSKIDTEYVTIYTRQMVEIGMNAANEGRRIAQRRSSSSSDYSSGGGGSSYSDGGSSASGSSSGGGFR